MKKETRQAMEKAKEIEKIPLPSKEEIVTIYREGMEEAEKLRKLLKPEWFIKDADAPKKKKTSVSRRKKKLSPTRKKKTL